MHLKPKNVLTFFSSITLLFLLCSIIKKPTRALKAVDVTPPAVSLNISVTDTIYSDTITLRGTARDMSSILRVILIIDNDTSKATLDNDTTWTIKSLKLNPGKNIIQLSATDASPQENKKNTVIANIYYEATPKPPSNLRPEPYQDIHVRIRWRDNSDKEDGFTIWRSTGGRTWKSAGHTGKNKQFFIDTTELSSDTIYYYTVSAFNKDGASPRPPYLGVKLPAIVFEDKSAPAVNFVSPLNRDSLGTDSITVTVSASDSSGIRTVTINGKNAVPVEQNYWNVKTGLSTDWNTITVVAVDNNDNHTTDSIKIYYNADVKDKIPPMIVFSSPEQNATVSFPNIMISGWFIEPSGIKDMTVNDSLVKLTDQMEWITPVKLDFGINHISISTTDLLGNRLDTTLTLEYNPTYMDDIAPVLQIRYPLNLDTIRTDTLTVWGTAYDPSGISSIAVNDSIADLEPLSWSANISLVNGWDTITVVATDSSALKNTSVKKVVVLRNSLPVWKKKPVDTLVHRGDNYSITVKASDPDNNAVTYILVSPPSPEGMTINNKNGSVEWTPNKTGTYSVKAAAFDGLECDTVSWSITVGGNPPEFSEHLYDNIPKKDTVGNTYTTALQAFDRDGLAGLVYGLITAPDGTEIIDTTGFITWQIEFEDTGSHKFTAIAKDPEGLSDTISWNVNIQLGRMRSPQFITATRAIDRTDTIGQLYIINLNATDIFPFALSYSLPQKPDGMIMDTSGLIKWTPTPSDTGTNKITAVVKNTQNRTDTLSWAVTVYKNRLAPEFGTSTLLDTCLIGNKYIKSLTATHPYGETITYFLIDRPTQNMSIDSVTGEISWVPDAGYKGKAHTVKAGCKVKNGLSDTLTWKIFVAQESPRFITEAKDMPASDTVGQYYIANITADDDIPGELTYEIDPDNRPAGLVIIKLGRTTAQITWTPDSSQITGQHTVVAIVKNKDGRSDSLQWNIKVYKDNLAPRFTTTDLLDTAHAGALYTKDIEASHPYANRPYMEALSITLINDSFSTIAITTLNDTAAQVTWTPSASHIGTDTITAVAATQAGLRDTLKWVVVIPNRAPVISSDTNSFSRHVRCGTTYQVALTATDDDNEDITYKVLSPTGMSSEPSFDSNILTWNLASDDTLGYRIITVQALDSHNGADTLSWQILAGNPALWNVNMALIPAGSFWMGDTFSENGVGDNDSYTYSHDSPAHRITLTKPFYIDSTETTYRDYVRFEDGHNNYKPEKFPSDSSHAVQYIDWLHAALYCNWRSKQVGLDTCYTYTDHEKVLTFSCDFSKNGYRLPTEAEWEYAARGGGDSIPTRFPWGNDTTADSIYQHINARGTGGRDTTDYNTAMPPVGWFPPAFGLYDMNGNVGEWCNDFAGTFTPGPQTDPKGPTSDEYGGKKVIRGGYCSLKTAWWRWFVSSHREFFDADFKKWMFGFRCVRNAE